MVHLKVNEKVLEALDGVGKVFRTGLSAKKHLPIGGGKFKAVDDVALQLKTVETIKSLHEVTQPKAPLVQNNTQFNSNFSNQNASHPGTSFESRLRKIREQRGLSNDEGVRVGYAEDPSEDQSVEDELSDIGIDLEDDDTEEGDIIE